MRRSARSRCERRRVSQGREVDDEGASTQCIDASVNALAFPTSRVCVREQRRVRAIACLVPSRTGAPADPRPEARGRKSRVTRGDENRSIRSAPARMRVER